MCLMIRSFLLTFNDDKIILIILCSNPDIPLFLCMWICLHNKPSLNKETDKCSVRGWSGQFWGFAGNKRAVGSQLLRNLVHCFLELRFHTGDYLLSIPSGVPRGLSQLHSIPDFSEAPGESPWGHRHKSREPRVSWATWERPWKSSFNASWIPTPLPWLESNDALPLAMRMETWLPWHRMRGSLISPSYLVRNPTLVFKHWSISVATTLWFF